MESAKVAGSARPRARHPVLRFIRPAAAFAAPNCAQRPQRMRRSRQQAMNSSRGPGQLRAGPARGPPPRCAPGGNRRAPAARWQTAARGSSPQWLLSAAAPERPARRASRSSSAMRAAPGLCPRASAGPRPHGCRSGGAGAQYDGCCAGPGHHRTWMAYGDASLTSDRTPMRVALSVRAHRSAPRASRGRGACWPMTAREGGHFHRTSCSRMPVTYALCGPAAPPGDGQARGCRAPAASAVTRARTPPCLARGLMPALQALGPRGTPRRAAPQDRAG
jgi:hypothetical protein